MITDIMILAVLDFLRTIFPDLFLKFMASEKLVK